MSAVDRFGSSGVLESDEDFSRAVTALFDSLDHAETARHDLMAAGVPAHAIALIADNEAAGSSPERADLAESSGFWQTLKELFLPEEDHGQFAEGVRRGGVTIVVRTDTANHDRIVALLDRDGAIDLDERQESWRHDGWTGYADRDPLREARSPSLAFAADDAEMSYAPASPATAGFGASPAEPVLTGSDAAPRVESPGALPPSALEAGADATAIGGASTRDLTLGTSRVRSYVRPGQKTERPDAAL